MNKQHLHLRCLTYLCIWLGLVLCQQDPFKITVHGRDFLLFKETTRDFTSAKKMCETQNFTLALFYTNDEYHAVRKKLEQLRETNFNNLRNVWVDIQLKVDNNDRIVEHEWKVEKINPDIWVQDEPNSNCKIGESKNSCCARLSRRSTSTSYGIDFNLRDHGCTNEYNFLCRTPYRCEVSNGGCDHQCVNDDGSYRSECKDGYQLNSDKKSCSNTDECAQTPLPCASGYEKMDGVCKDINECQNGTHTCTHDCHNTPGSYTCSCPDGYETSAHNKLACVDIDECNTGQHTCEHNCTNAEGNFSCSCLDGFKLDSFNNVSCHDINECAENDSICHHGCINTAGSYHCTCRTGFRLDQDQVSCVNTNRSFLCPCNCLTKHRTHEQREESVQAAEQEAKEIQRTLKVDIRTLSATIRKKVSIEDKRTSSETIGYMGVAFFSLAIALIVLPDVATVVYHVISCVVKRGSVSPEIEHF